MIKLLPLLVRKYNITCTQRPPKGTNKSGLLQQVVLNAGSIRLIQPFPKQALVFTCLPYKSFEKNCGKMRN